MTEQQDTTSEVNTLNNRFLFYAFSQSLNPLVQTLELYVLHHYFSCFPALGVLWHACLWT